MARPLNHRLLIQLKPQAHIPGGTTQAATVVAQKGSHSYTMTTADGTALVSLVASDSPAAGEAYLVATDSFGSTYWVTKLTAHVALVTQRTLNGTYEFATGSDAKWGFDSAVEGVVQIAHQ